MTKTLTLGDTSRNGLYQITDTAWSEQVGGTLRVTVRECVGERGLTKTQLEAMRSLARRAQEGTVTGAKTIRTWYADGGMHATFAVTRNEA